MLTVLSWNMTQRGDAWDRLGSLVTQHGVAVALAQEAKRPERLPDDWHTHPRPDDVQRWRIAVPRLRTTTDGAIKETERWFASAVVATGDHMIAAT